MEAVLVQRQQGVEAVRVQRQQGVEAVLVQRHQGGTRYWCNVIRGVEAVLVQRHEGVGGGGGEAVVVRHQGVEAVLVQRHQGVEAVLVQRHGIALGRHCCGFLDVPGGPSDVDCTGWTSCPPKGGRGVSDVCPPAWNLRAASLIPFFYISSRVLLPSPIALFCLILLILAHSPDLLFPKSPFPER